MPKTANETPRVRQHLILPKDLLDALKALAKSHGHTFTMEIVLALKFWITISRYRAHVTGVIDARFQDPETGEWEGVRIVS